MTDATTRAHAAREPAPAPTYALSPPVARTVLRAISGVVFGAILIARASGGAPPTSAIVQYAFGGGSMVFAVAPFASWLVARRRPRRLLHLTDDALVVEGGGPGRALTLPWGAIVSWWQPRKQIGAAVVVVVRHRRGKLRLHVDDFASRGDFDDASARIIERLGKTRRAL